MGKNKKILVSLLCGVLVIIGAVVTVTQFNLFDKGTTLEELRASQDLSKYYIKIVETLDNKAFNEKTFKDVYGYKNLKDASTYIVKVEVLKGQQVCKEFETETPVKVIRNIEGNINEGQQIKICEPAYFNVETQSYDTIKGYKLLEEGEQYYLFLNKVDGQDDCYVPSTLKFSQFKEVQTESIILDSTKIENKEYCYNDIVGKDTSALSKVETNLYNQIRKDFVYEYVQ